MPLINACINVSDDFASATAMAFSAKCPVYTSPAYKINTNNNDPTRLPMKTMARLLIYFENFSNKEAAKIMGKSVHNIETLVYRARKSLKSQLETEGLTYEKL